MPDDAKPPCTTEKEKIMSRTNHPRIPGTHRAFTKASRVDLDWTTPKHKLARRDAKVEIEGEIIAAQLDASEPARSPFVNPYYGLGTMPKPSYLTWMPGDEDPEPLADWERELLGMDAEDDVLVYQADYNGEVDGDDIAFVSDLHVVDVEDDDTDLDGHWLELMTFEQACDEMPYGWHVEEGPVRSERPSTKTSRDEWTVTSLARAWDVETSIMLAMLQDTALGNQSGLTASSRVPMHVISDQMERDVFAVTQRGTERSVMWVWNALMMGYTDTPANRRMGTAPRKPDAKRLKGDEEYAYRMSRLAEQWREVALTDECDSGCKVEVNGLEQTRVVHASSYGCTHPEAVSQQSRWDQRVATNRPHRPQPRNLNPFNNRY